jgi:protein required for attachment to host cells
MLKEALMKNIWIVIAHAAQAKVYDLKQHPPALCLLSEFFHPESRLKKNDILATEGGNHDTKSYGKGYARNNASFHSDVKQVEHVAFAKELSAFLAQAFYQGQFTELILIAEPEFHGLLNQELTKPVHNAISKHIQKNYIHWSEDKLLQLLLAKPDYA